MTPKIFLQVIASIASEESDLDNSYINIPLKWIKDNENGNQLINWRKIEINPPGHQILISFQTRFTKSSKVNANLV